MTKWIIYSLRRGNRNPFYVGTTNDWKRRLKEHKSFFGKRIILDILEEGDGSHADRAAAEHYWIQAYRDLGYKLANKTEGGDGAETLSAQLRSEISERFRGRVFTEEHRAKIGKAHKGRQWTPEQRARISATLKKRFSDPEMRQAVSDAMIAAMSPERRSEIARLGALAIAKKDPDAAARRIKSWWDSLSPDEYAAHCEKLSVGHLRRRHLL